MFRPYVSEAAIQAVAEVLRSPMIGQGKEVDELEARIQRATGIPYVTAMNTSSSAIRIALTIAGVGPQDEVVTTPLSCTLTNHPVLECFARPVFADIQRDTGNIDPQDVARRITAKTKAIICTHWGGTPADVEALNAVARRQAIPVIEDASEAFGASYQDCPIGVHSRFVAFSFQAIQALTTAEGGALSTQSAADDGTAKMLRWYGIDRKGRRPNELGYFDFDVTTVGFGYHMTNVAAAIGCANLEGLAERQATRAAIADIYWRGLARTPGLALLRRHADRRSTHHFFTVLVEKRDAFCRKLRAAGITTSIVHTRNDLYSAFGGLRHDLPNLDWFAERYICLPSHWGMTPEDAHRVVGVINEGW